MGKPPNEEPYSKAFHCTMSAEVVMVMSVRTDADLVHTSQARTYPSRDGHGRNIHGTYSNIYIYTLAGHSSEPMAGLKAEAFASAWFIPINSNMDVCSHRILKSLYELPRIRHVCRASTVATSSPLVTMLANGSQSTLG
jgi:hypothetical protein